MTSFATLNLFDDLIPSPSPSDSPLRSPMERMRTNHHLLARFIAAGKPQTQAAQAAGFSLTTVRILLKDPAFIELVSYYEAQIQDIFENTQERIGALGLSFLDELQHRLEFSPESFDARDLERISKMLLDRSIAPDKGAGRGNGAPQGALAAPVSISIKFVAPESSTTLLDLEPSGPGPLLEGGKENENGDDEKTSCG